MKVEGEDEVLEKVGGKLAKPKAKGKAKPKGKN